MNFTDIFEAAEKGTIEDVKYFIEEKGIDVNVKDKDKYTPLHHAVNEANLEVVQFLVSKGADVNARTDVFKVSMFGSEMLKGNEAPLHWATSGDKKIDIAHFLISKGADVNAKDASDKTPLHNASACWNINLIKLLLSEKADINARNSFGETPLHAAAYVTYANVKDCTAYDIVNILVTEGKADINEKDNDGETPLHTAVTVDFTKALISAGADVNVISKYRLNPLTKAAKVKRNIEIVQYLFDVLRKKAESNDVDAMITLYDSLNFVYGLDPKDEYDTEANYWIEKAANLGDASAQCELAGIYREERNDKIKAFEWMEKSAKNGYPKAKHNLACYYGENNEPEKALYWMEQASNDGHAGAKYKLGLFYLNGMGVTVDKEKAFSFMREAAALGDKRAIEIITEEEEKIDKKYKELLTRMKTASNYQALTVLSREFQVMNGYKDTSALAEQCDRMAKDARIKKYQELLNDKKNASTEQDFLKLAKQFGELNGFNDTIQLINECDSQYRLLKERRIEQERIETIKRKKQKKVTAIIFISILIASIGYGLYLSQENSIIIPDAITTIEENEFARKQLVNVVIPDSVISIKDGAFRKNKLSSIIVPDSVTTIGKNAFANNKLTSITIGPDVTIDNNAIDISFVNIYNSNERIAGTYRRENVNSSEWSTWHGNFRFENNNGIISIIDYDGIGGNVEIPVEISGKYVTIVGAGAFRNKNLTSINIPSGITTIGGGAFRENQISNVRIPNSVTLIENTAFYKNQLTNIEIGNGLTTIGESVFRDNKLSNIVIPSNIRSIAPNAFAENSITSLRIGANVTLGRDGNNGMLGGDNGFNTVYTNNNRRAGTYTRQNSNSLTWTRR